MSCPCRVPAVVGVGGGVWMLVVLVPVLGVGLVFEVVLWVDRGSGDTLLGF